MANISSRGEPPPPPPLRGGQGEQPQSQEISAAEAERRNVAKPEQQRTQQEAPLDVDERLRDNKGRLPDFEVTQDVDLKGEFFSFNRNFAPPEGGAQAVRGARENVPPARAAMAGKPSKAAVDESPLSGASAAPPRRGEVEDLLAIGEEEASRLEEQAALQLSVVREAARAETLAGSDALNREALTAAVADLLTTRKDKHPLAVALFGAWGAGKSSFIDFVKKELAIRPATPFRFAEFNAWRNERVDNIGAALAQSVVESLVADRSFVEQLKLALRLARRRKDRLRKALQKDARGAWAWVQRKWSWLSLSLMYFAWPLTVAAIFAALFVETNLSKWLVGAIGTAATSLTAIFSVRIALSKELLDWFKKLANDQRYTFLALPDYAEKLGSYHEMGRTLDDLCALTLSPEEDGTGESLLLVIDDLDRCSPDTIKQVFDAVRLMTNIPQVVVLVALDERIAYSAVAKHYAEYGFSDRETAQVARDYMSKVFNVFVTLPSAQKTSIENYVRARLFEMPSAAPAPASAQASAPAAQPRRQTLETSSKLEADTFAQLVALFDLSNPRELWRLRQTWSLLKGFALPEHAVNEEVRIWMRHMFFREMFLRGTAEQRKSANPALQKLIAGRELESADALWDASLTSEMLALREGFASRDASVMAVLLPAAPAELKVAVKS